MKVNRARPLVAFILVTLICAAVMIEGLRASALGNVVRMAPTPFEALQMPGAVLGSVLDARPQRPEVAGSPVQAVQDLVDTITGGRPVTPRQDASASAGSATTGTVPGLGSPGTQHGSTPGQFAFSWSGDGASAPVTAAAGYIGAAPDTSVTGRTDTTVAVSVKGNGKDDGKGNGKGHAGSDGKLQARGNGKHDDKKSMNPGGKNRGEVRGHDDGHPSKGLHPKKD